MDNRERQPNGSINIVLESGQQVGLPPNVKTVPTLLLLHHGNRVLEGFSEIWNYLQPKESDLNMVATQNNQEPLAFSMTEMGCTLSDNYSYLDMTPEELSAKGNGGLRQMHNYATIDFHQTIATPPDDYVADKVGEVDLGRMAQVRNEDIQQKT